MLTKVCLFCLSAWECNSKKAAQTLSNLNLTDPWNIIGFPFEDHTDINERHLEYSYVTYIICINVSSLISIELN